MLITAILLFLAAIVVHVFWRLIVRAAVLGLGLTVLAVVVRGMLLLEPRMAEVDLVGPALIGIMFGAVVVAFGGGFIWNRFVDDQAKDVKDKAEAMRKAKRLW